MVIRTRDFFHISTLVYRRKNREELLKHDHGSWVFDKVELKSLAVSFFKTMYTNDGIASLNQPIPNAFPSLPAEDLEGLLPRVHIGKLRKLFFNIGHWKALGLDGFLARFYEKFWHLLDKNV